MKLRLPLLVLVSLLALSASAADEAARLHALFDKTWETNLKENPMNATSVGRHDCDDRLALMTMPFKQRPMPLTGNRLWSSLNI